jgi:hypothetical protein
VPDSAHHATFGTPVTLVTGESGPMGIAVMPGKIFWTLNSGPTVRTASRTADGGASSASTFNTFLAPSPPATDLVADFANLYALTGPLFNASGGCQTVQVVSTLGGGMSFCEAISSSAVVRVAIDSANVYLSGSSVAGGSPKPAIVYIGKPGINEGPAQWSTYGNVNTPVLAMASDGGTLYYALTNRIFAQPITGGSPVPFAVASANISDLAVDGKQLYWLTTDGGVYAASKALPDGGMATPMLLAMGQSGPIRMALDSSNVYWTNQGDGTVCAAGKEGQFYEQVANNLQSPYGIAVDKTNVYWSDSVGGTIMTAAINP